jgi:sortase (surface protein transpeptidase)
MAGASMAWLLNFWQARFTNPRDRIIGAFLVGGIIGAGLVYSGLLFFSFLEPDGQAKTTESIGRSLPTHISIPSVKIEADFEAPLGVDDERKMTVPKGFDTVGWYEYSPTPGELGPSVVLGHVDSQSGPEVFHPLKDIEKGDSIVIKREDGSQAAFVVYEIEYYFQSRFPTGDVFGNVERPEIRLITCAGVFNKGTHQYSHNLVVYGYLADFTPNP